MPSAAATTPAGAHAPSPAPGYEPGGRYARYVLGLLGAVYAFNFLDRQVVSILAERIQADLGVSDAQLGYLYGTVFAVFYAVFGIPLARLADVWDRRKLIALGLAGWSTMTALSGLARNYFQLALARVGVGIGEASATPAAYSLLCDYFPPARRATALALYSSGIYIGAGLALGLGGLIVDRWDAAWLGTHAPFGWRGWQVAFFALGLPGLLLALAVRALHEPVRGQADGVPSLAPPTRHPWREFGRELAAVVPPFTLLRLRQLGAPVSALALNTALGALLAAGAAVLTQLLGSPAQWASLAWGLYAAASWLQTLALHDPPGFKFLFRTPALHYSNLGCACLSFTGYSFSFWIAPFFVRVHGLPAADVGLFVGGAAAAGGWLGVTIGGLLADRWRRRDARGRLWVGMLNAVLPVPAALAVLAVADAHVALVLCLPLYTVTALWLGPGASTVQDLVPPRLRAVASAGFLLVVTLLGLALGPWSVGRLSMATGSLRAALALALPMNAVALGFFLLAARRLPDGEAARLAHTTGTGQP